MSLFKNLCFGLFCILFISSISADEKYKIETIREYIKQLGDESYKVREKAIKDLTKLPYQNRKDLIAELKENKNLEIQDRLKDILKQSEDSFSDLLSELYLKSQQYYKEKNFVIALQAISMILDLDAEHLITLSLKAKILQDKGDYKECIVLLQKLLPLVIKDQREYADTNNSLFQVYLMAEEYTEAFNFIEKMNIKSQDAVKRLQVMIYELSNQTKKAEEIYLSESAKNTNNTNLDSTLAWFYIRTQRLEKAKPLLENIFKQNPPFSINNSLTCLFLEQHQKGIDDLKILTLPFINELKDKKDLSNADIDNSNVLYLCYHNYFEIALSQKATIDFKSLYNTFTQDAKKIWPIPLLGLYSGELTIETLEEQLKDPNPMEMRMKKCEGYFYLGLLKLGEKNTVEAKKYFQKSRDQKIFDYVETTGSAYFLQKLN